jgi:ribA/ribD-fused uncharacterized protein
MTKEIGIVSTLKTPQLIRFVGDKRFLSSYYPSTIYINGQSYPTLEHAWQGLKTNDVEERELIRKAPTPSEAKKLGQCVTLRDGWREDKLTIMEELVKKKFDNPFLSEMLLTIKDEEIVVQGRWLNEFWGVVNNVGKNEFGKILTKVRNQLQEQRNET